MRLVARQIDHGAATSARSGARLAERGKR
jgi:hypothetical protein